MSDTALMQHRSACLLQTGDFSPVIMTGFAAAAGDSAQTSYRMLLLDDGAIDAAMVDKMLALQDRVAAYACPHPDNKIDYKTLQEIEAHFARGGIGLGIFTASDLLIGQVLLSFGQPATGPFAAQGEASQANIDWLMVDRDYTRNFLCTHLLSVAITMAQDKGASQLRAHVRTHNERAIGKFSGCGFTAAGTGMNVKDGSTHLRFFRPVSAAVPVL